ncbi:MAG: hypothetical protein V1839_04230 [archaeon]
MIPSMLGGGEVIAHALVLGTGTGTDDDAGSGVLLSALPSDGCLPAQPLTKITKIKNGIMKARFLMVNY